MRIDKTKFTDIEDSFVRLKANPSDISAQNKMANALSSIVGKNIDVKTISPTNNNQECVVMSVYPDESIFDSIISAVVNNDSDMKIGQIWNSSPKWNIEIDTRILSKNFNLNEKELTALVLHEVGHIILSNSIPSKIAKVIKLEYAKSGIVTKNLLKDNLFSKLLCFPILGACNFSNNKKSLKIEIQADKYSVNSGYREYLDSAIDKILIYAGSGNMTDEDDMKSLMGFSIDSLLALQNRQNAIAKKNILKMIASTPSYFAKNIMGKVSTGLSGNGITMSESVKDKYINDKIDKIVSEAYITEGIFSRTHKMKRIDPADIDYIGLEINAVKSNDDKMMIVSYIYNKIDTIDYYIALIDSKNPKYIIPHTKESLLKMRKVLDDYRLAAINKKIPEISCDVKIQYPAGYEG